MKTLEIKRQSKESIWSYIPEAAGKLRTQDWGAWWKYGEEARYLNPKQAIEYIWEYRNYNFRPEFTFGIMERLNAGFELTPKQEKALIKVFYNVQRLHRSLSSSKGDYDDGYDSSPGSFYSQGGDGEYYT